MAALDLIACLVVNGRAPLATVLETLASYPPRSGSKTRRDANRRNQPSPPLGFARLGPLVLTDANPLN